MTTDTTAARDQRARDLTDAKAWLCKRWCQDDPNTQHVIQLADYAAHLRAADEAASQPARRGDQALREALEPVLHWYQSDEHADRPLLDIVADVVADLQVDRAAALRLAALPSSPAIQAAEGEAERTIAILRRALAWHGDPQRMATTREEWQQTIDDAIAWVKANPEPDRPSFSTLAALASSPVEGLTSGEGEALIAKATDYVRAGDYRMAYFAMCDAYGKLAATPAIRQDEPWPGFAADQDRRRVLTLARVGLMLSVMAGGNAPEVDGFDASDLYADVLMALAIEDAENPDIALAVVAEDPSAHLLIRQDEPEGAGVPIPEGWALVPVEPTADMLDGACMVDIEIYPHNISAGSTFTNTEEARAIWSQMLAASLRPAATDQAGEGERAAIRQEIINTPETADFMAGVPLEAAHQRERWAASHDAGKGPLDWFWLIGYLAQKAATAAIASDLEKAKHHTISTAAALANWHAHLTGADTSMRPGIAEPEGCQPTDDRGAGEAA